MTQHTTSTHAVPDALPDAPPDALPDAEHDPVTDVARLQEIGRYDLESPALRSSLDAFAKEAADLLDLPIGLVSIVLGGAQLFAGRYGLDDTWLAEAGGTPVEWSFCASAVRSGQPYVVPDAEVDPVQHDNPLVVLDGVRSYLGAPLLAPSGQVLGTCCSLGNEARAFTAAEVEALEEISTRIVLELERYAVA